MSFHTSFFRLCLLVFLSITASCNSQTKNSQTKNTTIKQVGGGCEGCEALLEYGSKQLTSTDTLPNYSNNQPQLKLTGTVFNKDGKTPAENVIVYIYHTNRDGIYETKGNETGWARHHGYIRGWVKTGSDGGYSFYTFRPASYPNANEPEHIHITVKEPNTNAYYLDDYLFDDDPKLTEAKRNRLENRGGSGIVKPELKGNLLTVTRDIVLGLNIPGYE